MKLINLDIKKMFFEKLNERQKRHFAAILAKDIGHGGQLEISKALNIEADTIRRGLKELESMEEFPVDKIRKDGGGRKKKLKVSPI